MDMSKTDFANHNALVYASIHLSFNHKLNEAATSNSVF